jgi:hypothetical protein
MGSLLIYRYGKGTKEIHGYNTSRVWTLVVFVILLACFVYLAATKPFGLGLWLAATAGFLILGFRVAKHRSPEIKQVAQTDNPLKMILDMAEDPGDTIEIYFKRPQEGGEVDRPNVAYVSFFSPRQGIPPRGADNHYRFASAGQTLYGSITGLLDVLKYEMPHKHIIVHFGWPLSSWIDRLSIGVMVFSIMRLPKKYPEITFQMEYFGKKSA